MEFGSEAVNFLHGPHFASGNRSHTPSAVFTFVRVKSVRWDLRDCALQHVSARESVMDSPWPRDSWGFYVFPRCVNCESRLKLPSEIPIWTSTFCTVRFSCFRHNKIATQSASRRGPWGSSSLTSDQRAFRQVAFYRLVNPLLLS